jgi:proteasome lid subunit RPN8/RPN11
MRIAQELLDQMIDHARREAPNECCGVVGVRDGRATRVLPVKNEAASPLKFEMGIELFYALDAIDEAGEELGAIYHSHTRTFPYPSQTDINWSDQYPGAEWLIVGLENDEALVRSYLIEGGRVEEVPVEVQ